MAAPEHIAKWDHRSDSDQSESPHLSDKVEQDPKLKDFDLEGQGRRLSHSHVALDSSSTSESVGRQIELEAENGIKYRTCSWQKVGFGVPCDLQIHWMWRFLADANLL